MKNKKNISLIGMPAVGKSTVGHLLARQIGFQFLDSDDLICKGEQQTLAEIIADQGLSRFLAIEEKHILSIECTRHVIATGGSVIYCNQAMAHLRAISTILYLHVDCETLQKRLNSLTSRGVAISPGTTIEALYKQRAPLYDAWCDIKIDCKKMTPEQVSSNALKLLL